MSKQRKQTSKSGFSLQRNQLLERVMGLPHKSQVCFPQDALPMALVLAELDVPGVSYCLQQLSRRIVFFRVLIFILIILLVLFAVLVRLFGGGAASSP